MDLVKIAQNAYVQMGTALFLISYLVAILLLQKEGFKPRTLFQGLYRQNNPGFKSYKVSKMINSRNYQTSHSENNKETGLGNCLVKFNLR